MSAFLIRLLLEHLKIGTKSRMRLRTWPLGTRPPIRNLVSVIVMTSFCSEKHFQMDKILQNNSHNVVTWEFYPLWTTQKQTNVMKLILCEFFHIQWNSKGYSKRTWKILYLNMSENFCRQVCSSQTCSLWALLGIA